MACKSCSHSVFSWCSAGFLARGRPQRPIRRLLPDRVFIFATGLTPAAGGGFEIMRTASFFHYRACPAKREPSLSASGPEGPPVAGGEGGEVRFLKGDERRSVQSSPQKEALRMRSETRTAPSVQSSPQKGKLFPPHVPRFRQKPPGRFLPAFSWGRHCPGVRNGRMILPRRGKLWKEPVRHAGEEKELAGTIRTPRGFPLARGSRNSAVLSRRTKTG